MSIKLFTIGDSISQGFMSLAAARTDLSYSTLLAEKLGAHPDTDDYRYPKWPEGGLPVNLETVLRRLTQRYGTNIRGLEWLTVLHTINEVMDRAEDYYERGAGKVDAPYQDGNIEYFHNIAVQGFDLADAWLVTPALCKREIGLQDKAFPTDGYLTGPNAAFYRTALKVLNPSLDDRFDDFSAITWLETHAKAKGVENLVLWLGANNALGTVLDLKIRQTPNDEKQRPFTLSHLERAKIRRWNLWHPEDFKAEYEELLNRVDAAMKDNSFDQWKIFVGTIPLVTIAPVAKGVGSTTKIDGKGVYYKYYTYFPFEEEFAHKTGMHLTMQDAIHIDDCIRAYNRFIISHIKKRNAQHGQERYFVVDIAEALNKLAYKRNAGNPTYKLPKAFDYLHPQVNTKYYHADENGVLKQGGIVSLDGVHPSVIGHGIIAYEFLQVMKEAGIVPNTSLNWDKIFANDLLYQQPIPLMHELYGHDQLAAHLLKFIKLLSLKD